MVAEQLTIQTLDFVIEAGGQLTSGKSRVHYYSDLFIILNLWVQRTH